MDSILVGAIGATIVLATGIAFLFKRSDKEEEKNKAWVDEMLLEQNTKTKSKAKNRKKKIVAENREKVAEAENRKKEAEAENRKKEAEAENRKKEAEAENLENDAEAENRKKEAEAEKRRKEAEAEKRKKEAEKNAIERKIAEHERARKKAEKKCEDCENSLAKAEKKISALSSSVSELEKSLKIAKSKLDEKAEKKEAEKNTLTKACEERSVLVVQNVALRKEVENSRAEVRTTASRLLACEVERRDAIIKSQAQGKTIELRDAEILVLKAEKDNLQRELEELNTRNTGLKQNVDEQLPKIDELVTKHQEIKLADCDDENKNIENNTEVEPTA